MSQDLIEKISDTSSRCPCPACFRQASLIHASSTFRKNGNITSTNNNSDLGCPENNLSIFLVTFIKIIIK